MDGERLSDLTALPRAQGAPPKVPCILAHDDRRPGPANRHRGRGWHTLPDGKAGDWLGTTGPEHCSSPSDAHHDPGTGPPRFPFRGIARGGHRRMRFERRCRRGRARNTRCRGPGWDGRRRRQRPERCSARRRYVVRSGFGRRMPVECARRWQSLPLRRRVLQLRRRDLLRGRVHVRDRRHVAGSGGQLRLQRPRNGRGRSVWRSHVPGGHELLWATRLRLLHTQHERRSVPVHLQHGLARQWRLSGDLQDGGGLHFVSAEVIRRLVVRQRNLPVPGLVWPEHAQASGQHEPRPPLQSQSPSTADAARAPDHDLGVVCANDGERNFSRDDDETTAMADPQHGMLGS